MMITQSISIKARQIYVKIKKQRKSTPKIMERPTYALPTSEGQDTSEES